MNYTFDSYHNNGVRFDSTTRIEDIQADFSKSDYVIVLDNRKNIDDKVAVLRTEDDLIEWNMSKAFSAQWKPKSKERAPWDPLAETDGFHVKGSGIQTEFTLPLITKELSKDAINPSHYQAYIKTEIEELQWLEAMQYLPRFRNPESFKAAVELQGRKYFDRNGGKDSELQELQKGLWYFKFLVAYIKNGNKPIRVKDIDIILSSK